MALRSTLTRRLGAFALSVGIVVGLGACAPVHTLDLFDPSDGVRAELEGEVKATNLLVLATEEGAPGALVGSLTNITKNETEVTVTVGEANPVSVPIDAGYTVYLTPRETNYAGTSFSFDAQLSNVSAEPGANVSVEIATASGGSSSTLVPVLDGTLEPYDEYLP